MGSDVDSGWHVFCVRPFLSALAAPWKEGGLKGCLAAASMGLATWAVTMLLSRVSATALPSLPDRRKESSETESQVNGADHGHPSGNPHSGLRESQAQGPGRPGGDDDLFFGILDAYAHCDK
eukprot:TRINITY_DN34647_c0_g1_i3.p1 TRINITY_DN34647_c0_g1~~TRINITY_DN34647_c0_g1_i3.p1  ORF type:complete len:122 (+),score=19.71 TRINITY_DN34647_c0_g1_i3:21-386(+)